MSFDWGGSCSRKRRPFEFRIGHRHSFGIRARIKEKCFKEIGNVDIDVDNNNIAVAVPAILGVFLGSPDGTGVQSLLRQLSAECTRLITKTAPLI